MALRSLWGTGWTHLLDAGGAASHLLTEPVNICPLNNTQ